MTFQETAARREWFDDPENHNRMVFGDRSELCVDIGKAAKTGDFGSVIAGIDSLLAEPLELLAYLAPDDAYPKQDGMAVLQGIRSGLMGLQAWILDRSVQDAGRPFFQKAIGYFDAAWQDAPRGKVTDGGPVPAVVENDPLWRTFAGLGDSGTSAGFWITWDLVDRLRHGLDSTAARSQVRGSATTPILVVDGTKGHVLWLTVELVSDGRGFDPDPLALGLTAVRNAKANDDEEFLASMRDVWQKSGLAGICRGRWRVTDQCPVEGDHPFQNSPKLHSRRLSGRSAEAAALAAIWAAHGTVPYREPFSTVGGLALDVAISASLGNCQPKEPLTSIPLEGVASVSQKLDAAKLRKLDTVLLARNEESSKQEQEIGEERKKAARAITPLRRLDDRAIVDDGRSHGLVARDQPRRALLGRRYSEPLAERLASRHRHVRSHAVSTPVKVQLLGKAAFLLRWSSRFSVSGRIEPASQDTLKRELQRTSHLYCGTCSKGSRFCARNGL